MQQYPHSDYLDYVKIITPANGQLMDVSILNEEIEAAISKSGKTRDKYVVYQQMS